MKHGMTRRPRQTGDPRNFYDFTIDLHGMYAEEAMALIEKMVWQHPNRSILVIHGNGEGILRSRIRHALASNRIPNREYHNGEDLNAPGLDGVTVIYT